MPPSTSIKDYALQGFCVKIVAKYHSDDVTLATLLWTDMRFELRMKYNWYFKYRAALLQVAYPKAHVQFLEWKEVPSHQTAEHIWENKLRAKRAKVTKWKNALDLQVKHWRDLFPIEDYEPYQKALEKYNKAVFELRALEQEAQNHLSQTVSS